MKPRPADQTGILMHEGGRLILSMPSGGHWRIDLECRFDKALIGAWVRVLGERIEFNTIAAGSIEPA